MGQPVRATEWLHDLAERFDAEFDRCWIKAGRHPRDFHQPPKTRPKWISHDSDQSRVFSLLEIAADAGEPLWMRAVRTSGVLDGKMTEGRITEAVEALIERRLILKATQGRGKQSLLFPVPLEPAPDPPAPEPPEREPDPEQSAWIETLFEEIDRERFLSSPLTTEELQDLIEDDGPKPSWTARRAQERQRPEGLEPVRLVRANGRLVHEEEANTPRDPDDIDVDAFVGRGVKGPH